MKIVKALRRGAAVLRGCHADRAALVLAARSSFEGLLPLSF